MSVCVSVCPSVCSLLGYRLIVFFCPLFSKVRCPQFLEIRKNCVIVAKKSCLQIFFPLVTPFELFFAPTPQSPISKLFRFSKSLGKSNEKRWSQIWILLLIKGVKLQRNKRLIFNKFCLTIRIVLVSVLLSASVERFFLVLFSWFFVLWYFSGLWVLVNQPTVCNGGVSREQVCGCGC